MIIYGFLVLLACQWLGEWLMRWLSWPIPGPVAGMVILLGALLLWGKVPVWLRTPSEGLLSILVLLFVPAGVGLIQHLGLLGAAGPLIVAVVLASTLLTLVVSLWVFQGFAPKQPESSDD
jgi:holin-like protein